MNQNTQAPAVSAIPFEPSELLEYGAIQDITQKNSTNNLDASAYS